MKLVIMYNENNNTILIVLLSLIISSCSSKEPKEFTVKDLDTIEKRRIFLDSILAIDQKVRIDVMLAQQQFGNESKKPTLEREVQGG
jgi:hypothetical protein